jgi:hypothetical protein
VHAQLGVAVLRTGANDQNCQRLVRRIFRHDSKMTNEMSGLVVIEEFQQRTWNEQR